LPGKERAGQMGHHLPDADPGAFFVLPWIPGIPNGFGR
jgi:hypothetical protein